MSRSSRGSLFFALMVIAAIVPGSIWAQCTLVETFDGAFDVPWQLTNPEFVGIRGDVLAVEFLGPNAEFQGAVLDPCVYSDFRAGVQMRDLDSTRGKAIAFRTRGPFVGYNVNLRSEPFNDIVLSRGWFPAAEILSSAPFVHSSGEWVAIEIEARGPDISVYVNSSLAISYLDPEPGLDGWIFLGINAGATSAAHAEFDSFWVSELEPAIGAESLSWGTIKARFDDAP